MVLCLLVISVHAAYGGEQSHIDETEALSQMQIINTVITSDDHIPSDEKQINSECSICHAAHVLLVYAPENLAFSLYSGLQYYGRERDVFTSHIGDIIHPPIISV